MPLITTLAGASARGYGGLVTFGVPSSYESIASVTASGSSAYIDFTSIPSDYKHLQIRGIIKNPDTVGRTDYKLYFNSGASATYGTHSLYGDGGSVYATGTASATQMAWAGYTGNFTADFVGVTIIDIHDYASTTKNKTVRAFWGYQTSTSATTNNVGLASSVWVSTSAITSLSFFNSSGSNFASQTQFALYGIKG